ncbi:hypothetical protein RKD19_007553 [Streptomyces canus]
MTGSDSLRLFRDAGEPTGLGLQAALFADPVLLPGDEPGEETEDHQQGQGADPAVPALPGPSACPDRGFEELPFQRREFGGVGGEMLLDGGQSQSAVQGLRVAVQGGPGLRRLGEGTLGAQPFTVLVDPGAQPGPGAEHGLVGQVHRPVVDGDQPGPGELFEDQRGVGPVGAGEFGAVGGPPGVGGALARGDQPQQEAAGGVGLPQSEALVEVLGGAGDGPVDAAGRLVGRLGQGSAPASAPGLQQGVGEQREPTRLVRDLVQQPCGQGAFDDQAAEGRGPDDGLAQFVRGHRRHQEGRLLGGLGEPAVAGEMAVEVGAYGDHDAGGRAGGGEEQVEEAGPLVGVRAEGEEFLELVDDDQGRPGPQGLGVGPGGMRSRGEDQGPSGKPREQAGAQQ